MGGGDVKSIATRKRGEEIGVDSDDDTSDDNLLGALFFTNRRRRVVEDDAVLVSLSEAFADAKITSVAESISPSAFCNTVLRYCTGLLGNI